MLFLCLTACDIPERPRQVTISHPPVFRPANPEEIKTVEQALAAVITVCRDDLHLPVVDPLQVFLYKNQASLAFYGHGWRTLPVDISNELAFARNDTIHINLQPLPQNAWGIIAGILAHEYAHTVHRRIAGPKRSDLFVAEGFGEWVAAKVSHSLKWQDYAIALHRGQREILRQWQSLPDIPTLKDSRRWMRLRDQPNGYTRTYTFAFLVMDRLIQRKGLPVVLEYLREGSGDQFIASFNEYVDDLGKTAANSIQPRREDFSIGPPSWKIGYKWTYIKTTFGSVSTVVKEIIAEETYRGTQAFVFRTPEEDTFYGKNLGFVASKKNGKIISDVVNPPPFFSWPLQPGKESRDSLVERNFAENRTTKRDRLRVIPGLERVKVPAGDFNAVKVESFEELSGRLTAEYWYVPEVKWFREEEDL